jgi:hypothetical protein
VLRGNHVHGVCALIRFFLTAFAQYAGDKNQEACMRSVGGLLTMSRVITLLIVFALGAVVSQWKFLSEGLSIFHINSVSAIPMFQLKLFQDNLLAGRYAPITWTKSILTGLPLSGGLPTFNPLFIPVALLFHFEDAVIAYDVLLKIFGAIGMYCYLRRMRLSTVTAMTSALLYVVNPFFAATGQDLQFGTIVYWMPWIALVLFCHFENFSLSVIRGLATGVICALVYLSTNILSFFSLVVFFVLPMFISSIIMLYPETRRDVLLSALKLSTLVVAIFLSLIAFDIVPAMEMLANSGRASGLLRTYVMEAAVVAVVHVGLCWLLFRRERASFMFGLGIACISLVSGLYILSIPPVPRHSWGGVLGPETFQFSLQRVHYLLTYAQLALALSGLATLRKGNSAAIVAILGLAWWSFLPLDINNGYASRTTFVPVFCLSVLVAFGLESLMAFCSRRGGFYRLPATAVFLFVVCEAFGMYFSNTLFTPGIKALAQNTPETEYLSHHRGRVAWTYVSHEEVLGRIVSDRSFIWLEWMMSGYYGAIPFCFNGVNILPPVVDHIAKYAYPRFFGLPVDAPTNNFLDLASVRTIVSRYDLSNNPGLRLAVKGDQYMVYENTGRLPRLRLVGALTVLPANEIPLALAQVDRDQLLDLAYTDTAMPGAPNDLTKTIRFDATETSFRSHRGEVSLLEDSDTRTRISCDIKIESYLILADTYDPRWRGRIDGFETSLMCVNGAFIGVRVPEGAHEIVLEYAPPLWRAAGWLSLIFWAGTLLALALGAWRQRSTVLR